MLTLFAVPKPFRGHIAIVQTNAIQSWLVLVPKPEVILLGNDEGIAEIAARFGIRHIAEVEYNEYGTPLLNSVFAQAQATASNPLMGYVNADIILLSDFLPAISQIRRQPFLLVGQRRDVDVKEPIDFNKSNWEAELRSHVAAKGKLHPPTGIDYFVFSRGLYQDIPPLAIGRTAWDNWLVYKTRCLKAPVIDATRAITAIHQNHDYAHRPGAEKEVWKGAEAQRNIGLMGGATHGFTLDYATLLLTPRGVKRALTPRHLYFRLEAAPFLTPWLGCFRKPVKKLTYLIIWVRSKLGIAKSDGALTSSD